MTLQVPVSSFATVLTQVEALGTTSQVSTKAIDVTGQYVDLQARLNALEASRQQYLTIMTRATSIGDVLNVQAQLDTLQSQIEQLQGQLDVLGSETNYSTLTTQLREVPPPHRHRTQGVGPSGLAKAWHNSVHGFVTGAEGLLSVGGPLAFALLCLGGVVVAGRVLWRHVRRRHL